jgi:hypothetical protein
MLTGLTRVAMRYIRAMTFPLNVFCPELWKIDETFVYTCKPAKSNIQVSKHACTNTAYTTGVFSIRFSAILSTSTVKDVGETVAVCMHMYEPCAGKSNCRTAIQNVV